ncbi:T9SS type B sorting domain-containing protein [Allomuricauda sp. SCSIO 64092]|uniref:T9SS type B sorting domain-containing protein n=1 Tax=Allomuricauda sp. SCSIO 64092 TaxID=2908842 RepID=UPI00391A9A0E
MYTDLLPKVSYIKHVFCILLVVLIGQFAQAQLSDLHYLPPLKQGQNNQGIRDQAIYLSTPEPTSFVVNVYRGTNAAPWRTYNIDNTNPAIIDAGEGLTNGDNNITLVNNANTGVVLTNSGLRFESPSGNRFYVNYRGFSSSQAASLTAKGRQAMGTHFKWGGVPNLGNHPSKSNTLGIMATEDNTTINLFGYDPGCQFRVGNNVAGITDNTVTITLDANESFVFETYIGNSPTLAHERGWIGASIEADKDIVISNGSINYGRQVGATNRDAGIDQPVPENRLGKDYVFIRGNGASNGWTEFPLLIAIEDNTQIFVNGNPTPLATLNTGDFFEIPSSYYSSNNVGANMFVQTSKNVYAYQCLGGDSKAWTQGLNFVAPVNCLLPDVMDNIPDIRNMAGATVTGGMTIIAAVNTPDANIIVEDGNGPVTLPASNPVAGSADWKTFYIPNLNGNVSVQSTGPMAIGFFGFDGNRGVAGYFSGFDTVPEVILEIRGGTGCFVGSEIFEATESFDAYQWFRDGQLIPGANAANYAPTIAGDYYVRGTKGPCTYDSNTIQALYCDPDIILDKTVDNNEIMEGETATFTIRVRNLGAGPVTNLQITDNIPTGLTLINAFTISGTWSGNTWNIGTLDGGDVAELELEVRGDEIDILPLLSLTNTVTNTQDQTDTNTTPDNPTALITVHNDSDDDGIRDITDLDDDNDGIYDEDECDTLAFTIANGASHNSALVSVDNYLVMDVFSIDNSFNLDVNGNDVAGEVQFQLGEPGNFARFYDGTTYGEAGNPDIWTITGTNGTPILRVVIDQAGQFELFGTRSTNGPLEPMVLDTPPTPISWNSLGNNTITIGQDVVGPTNMRGVLLTAGCDTDSDGIPDHLDLDSDGDGCSDANEFYKDNNADGGDGGEYGTGTPVVDSTDGTVNDASYIQVFAPEIILGNTSEDLGGTNINGQGVSLGQAFQYVLRFQNTGDDNAVNYSIRNILPNNVTLDNVNVVNAPGVTHTHDINTNEISFQVPDNLVEVGDPEYTIRIFVTLSGNCSDFVDACSDTLENRAYSTYQGVLNPSTFTDENGAGSVSACSVTPEVATNTILDDLANCNTARTVQLCGADVLLTAGSGFTNYTWALDTNGNGQIDGSETPIDDGDADGDPSTLLVTDIGNYIVEKTGATGCSDATELITVERFGTTQTNPIIGFFNQVNSDSNPDNDLQGEIVTCSIDGDLLPKIFLCGATDEATIQLGITDADSIVWQRLDETSCADTGDDCANKNGTCAWTDLATQNNFTVTDSGEYRVVINYQNGCFSRFFFNVFKNTLDIDHNASDILCSTPGNIRVTNIGSGYGFQLVDAVNDNIIVPFSDDNGPNFDITTSGTYKVQVTPLNPVTGDPIAGSCIFETADIGILERDYQVNITTTAAECNALGAIGIQALNVLPNYAYELRLDDGSNGGLGTFVDSQVASNDNTYTFNDVNPGNYIVITTTDDGCSDTQNVTVGEVPELTLDAVTTSDITCNAGVITLTPNGGSPNPDYGMAIWAKDGVPLYATPADVPNSAKQSTTNFLFGYRGTPEAYFPNEDGDYQFIVFDGNDCSAFSNVVSIQDLGTVSISASHSAIVCADSATSTLTVTATGGTAPYQYSLDGGTTYQMANTFVNLPAGFYTITVMDSSGTPTSRCIETLDYEIDQPFRLTASAAIVEDASCSSSGALVKILNASGGQAPYEYSFDGGSSFGTLNERNLLSGNYQLVVRDALGCTFPMDLTVPTVAPDPNLSYTIDYDCNGLGTITVSSSNTTDFDYTYTVPPTWTVNNNIFSDVPDGTHTITVGYSSTIAPNQTTLFFENFGAGPTTQIAEIGSDYCFEPQDGSLTNCNRGPAGILVNGEYTVTNFVTNPVSFWTSPQDHTGLTDGRFLSIDVSTFSDTGNPQLNNILWAKRDIEVLPNEEITLNFWAYNLMNLSGVGNNPEVLVEILDNTGTVIYTEVAPEIPKNTGNTDWHERTITFNPGVNTDIDIVFRTNVNSNDGNDLILDDITAFQIPEVCEKTQDFTVVIQADQAFEAQLLSTIDPSCNGIADGFVRFEVSNFTAGVGFEYSFDGTAWTTSMTSPVTTAANLADGSYTLQVRKLDDISCAVSFPVTLTEPSIIVPSLAQIADYTCFNTGGTLEASATGGNPSYEYQLETSGGAIVTPYQTNAQFTNVPNGDYVVRVMDQNGCEVVSTAPVTIIPPANIAFDVTPTACYSGSNDGTIVVNVTSGNGNYEFRIDGGPWITPSPVGATSYTFTGLSAGNYDIEVRDQLGCPDTPNIQNVDINPQLVVAIEVTQLSACNDGLINVNATGGNGTLLYAIVPANTSPAGLYSTTNSLTVTDAMATANPAGYDVYVQDNNGGPALCSFVQEDIILTPVATLSANAVPTDPECFDGLGAVDVTVGGGTAPYTYALVDLSPADGIDYGRSNSNISTTTLAFNGIGVGDYEVTVTDVNGCTVTSSTVTINNVTEITADITPILPATCTSTIESEFGFEFINITTPSGTPGTVEYSNDGGTTWQTSTELRGSVSNPTFSGTEVFPSIRVEVSPGVYCQKDFDRYIIPFPLDDLDITIFPQVLDCNDLQVTVQGSRGDDSIGYRYTYTDDPANFGASTPVWTARIPTGTPYTWANIDPTTPALPGLPLLVPGRTYVFYVQDGSNCIRQSNVNVNEVPSVNLPIEIATDVTPTCSGGTTGELTFTLTPDTAFPNMRWEIYELGNATPIEVSGGGATAVNVGYNNTITSSVPLSEGEYYLEIIQVDGTNTDACRAASENAYVPELAPLNATAVKTRDISCNLPGLIAINGISGGGGAPYTYDVSGPGGLTINGTTNNPVEIPVNSPAGNYTVTLYDQYSCPLVLNTVSMNLTADPTITSVTQDNCTSPIDVTVVGTPVAGNLRYAMVSNGAPVPTAFEDNGGVFSNVSPGTYDIYVTDDNGCIASQIGFVVEPVLSASATLTKLLDCTASAEATIAIEILDGSGNYEYSITNTAGAPAVTQTVVPAHSFDYQAPLAGDYTITIYDTNTPSNPICDRVFVINVPDRVEPALNPAIVTDVSCLGAGDGSIIISTTNGAAAPYTFEITAMDGVVTSIAPTSTTGNSATFTGLAPTTTAAGYVITVTGDSATNNCSVNSPSITISEPKAITVPAPTIVEFGCTSGNTTNNASITVNDVAPFVQGGSGNYIRYEFIEEDDPNTLAVETPSTVQSGTSATYIETDPAGGVYTINVYDDNGCVGTTTATIAPFDVLGTPTITVDEDISCNNSGEDITIDIVGSLTSYATHPGNYQFRMLPSSTYQASNQFLDLSAGSHTFGILNVNTGCEQVITHLVEEPNTFDIIVEKLADVVCFGDDGSIRLTMVDATYSNGFTWNIYNTNGTPTDRTDDGPVFLTGSSANLGPTVAIAVPAGDYLVEVVQDAFPECSQVRSFNIATPPASISLDPIALTDVGCTNDQGTALIAPRGGQAPYTIALTHVGSGTTTTVTSVNSHLFQSLTAGDYEISVTDALTCNEVFTGTDAFSLVLPDPITGTATANSKLVCEGDTDASISFSLNPRNVITNYRYVLNTYNDAAGSTLLSSSVSQTTPTFNNLGAGFYSISVTDDMGCTFETAPVLEIQEPTGVEALLVTNRAISCQTNAELLLVASGGTAPYEWSLDGSAFNPMNEMVTSDTHLFQNVPASPDSYRYYIRDSFNCISIVSNAVGVEAIETLTVTLDTSAARVNCTGDSTALIDAVADGGLGNYQFALFRDQANTDEVRPNQTDGTFADLPMGTYYVRVQSGDCEVVSEQVLIGEPTPLVVNPTITEISCADANDGSITLDVQGGSGDYQFAISPNLNQFDDENSFDELSPGDYIVIVQDGNGCFEVVEFSLIAPSSLAVTSTVTDEICFESADGTVTLEINGGTAPYFTSLNSNADTDFNQDVFQYTDLTSGTHVVFIRDANGCEVTEVFEVSPGVNLAGEAIVEYPCDSGITSNRVSLSFEDPSTTGNLLYGLDTADPAQMVLEGTFEGIPGGDHYITVMHSNGCTNTFDFSITEFDPLGLQLTESDINTITALATGGSGNYTFTINDETPTDDAEFYITETATYTITVTDENGCSVTEEIFMEFIDIEIPNFFTPDGDGHNDTWAPRNMGQYQNIFIKIYDRYGRTLYQFRGNEDDWDGQYQLSDLPTGDYWYIIKLNGIEDQREFIGNFTLYR